jgi:Na+-transporting methylmalonyl-CoA/oxaloacetate decarboxylase beta subunit
MGIKPPNALFTVTHSFNINHSVNPESVNQEVKTEIVYQDRIVEKIVEVPTIQEKIVEVPTIIEKEVEKVKEVLVKNNKLVIITGVIAFIIGVLGGIYGCKLFI